ncbi:MAG: hypothetical protein ABIJ41_04125 [Candidatus Omnitrophota bacterium]
MDMKFVNFKEKKGITLVASVMLLVFASIAVLGVTTFIVQRLALDEVKLIQAKTIYLAQAGLNQAIYDYRINGFIKYGQIYIDANHFFVLGGSSAGGSTADSLMVDTSRMNFSSNRRDLDDILIRNANALPITIDRMIITWSDFVPPASRLQRIRIGNSWVWSGNLASPADANISNFSLTAPTVYPIKLRFDNTTGMNDPNNIITIRFIMTDGSTKDVIVWPPPPSGSNFTLTIKSMGRTELSKIFRTIEAQYNISTGIITDYHEIIDEIYP